MAERGGSRVSFFSPAESEHRQPRPAETICAPGNSRSTIGRTVAAPSTSVSSRARALQHAVGEDMAALEIGAELDFVDRQERHVEVARHGLDGGNPEARIGRLDLLLAGDQRHRVLADAIDHLVVDLARQQPQRQPDHAGGMGQHPLDGEMRLAGIGRPQHGGDAGAAGTRGTVRLRGKGDGHYASKLAAGHFRCPTKGFLYHNATTDRAAVKLWNESGTNRARIADSGAVRLRSRRYLASRFHAATRSGSRSRFQTLLAPPNVNMGVDSDAA